MVEMNVVGAVLLADPIIQTALGGLGENMLKYLRGPSKEHVSGTAGHQVLSFC